MNGLHKEIFRADIVKYTPHNFKISLIDVLFIIKGSQQLINSFNVSIIDNLQKKFLPLGIIPPVDYPAH